jgi:hypothetical protein
MDLDNTSPGPEASEHLKVFMCVKYGIDICCDALKVIKQKDKKEQMQLFTDINGKWRLYKGTHDTLSVGQKGDVGSQPVPVTEMHKVVDEYVMPAMKAMAATVLEEEQGRFDSGLLCKRSAWKDHQDKLCLETMYKGELSGEMASIPSHACSNLVELYGMCGQDSDASKTTSASVADTMRRALAGIYHAAQQRPTFAAIYVDRWRPRLSGGRHA